MTWTNNSRACITKAKRAIGSLRRMTKGTLTRAQMRHLLFSKVLPILSYGMCASYPTKKTDQLALERLLRFACQVSLNDFQSSYLDLLAKIELQPFYSCINHRRILLAHSYQANVRYQPPGTVMPFQHITYLRRRFHDKALSVTLPTPLRMHSSALEDTVLTWNKLPQAAANLTNHQLKRWLKRENYSEPSDAIHRSMQASIRVL
jgi:hypothetical protein